MMIALLRGINVGGHNVIAMAALRALFENLGFAGAQSLLQSGNVVFKGGRCAPTPLERFLEAETERHLNVRADYFVRTADEWSEVVERNPFPREAQQDPSHFLVMVLKQAPGKDAADALRGAIKGPEVVRTDGRHAYLVYPDGMARSKLTPSLVEARLGSRGTARNWNTVLKLRALATP